MHISKKPRKTTLARQSEDDSGAIFCIVAWKKRLCESRKTGWRKYWHPDGKRNCNRYKKD